MKKSLLVLEKISKKILNRTRMIVNIDKREFIIEDHVYSTPTNVTIYGLYYNKKLFEENGWDEKLKNWKEFMSLCKKIKATGIYPMVSAGQYPYYLTYGWGTIPYSVGGDEFRDAQYNFERDVYNSDSFKNMLSKMEQFAKSGYFHPGTISFDHTQSQMEFLQGKAAMITNATWIANEMAEVTPEGFVWGFMPFPGNDKSSQAKVVFSQGGGGFRIWKNKPDLEKKWAKEFQLWLLNMDVQKAYAQHGSVPARKDFVENPNMLKGVSPSVVVALEKLNELKNVKIINRDARCRVINNAEMAKLSKVLQDGYISIISGKKSADDVAKEVNKQYLKGLDSE